MNVVILSNLNRISFIVILQLVYLTSFAQVSKRECGSTLYSFNYYPSQINSLSQLPQKIQDSVTNHLKRVLGDKFYSQIYFNGGLIINYTDLVKADPKVKEYRWQVPMYDLCYFLRAEKSGISFCGSRITLDSLGNVVQDIEFPKKSLIIPTTKFLPKKQLLDTAKKLGFLTQTYDIGISQNNIVLIFAQAKKYEYLEYLEISVHTGRVIRRYKVTGMIDWD